MFMYTCLYILINIFTIISTTDALPRPPTSLPFMAVPSLNTGLPRNATPLHYFQLFMTVSVWQYILNTTNAYARARLASVLPRRRSVFRNWRDIIMVEMKAFIRLIIQMGLVQLSDIKEYWSTHVTLNLPFFRGCSMWEKHQTPPNVAKYSLSWT